MSTPSLSARLEALLFIASEPVTADRLAEATGTGAEAIQEALKELSASFEGRGIAVSQHDDKYRLVTAPDVASTVRQFLQEEGQTELSRAALETLAIVAYRGPLTRLAIEQIRGVASETMLRNLLSRGLITEAGRSEDPGRPALYGISHSFLQHFGLTSLAQLPPLPVEPDKSQHAD